MQVPVLLDIWAPWCGPCKTLGPVLEKLETSYAGRFSLGKLNADEQPEIAAQLSQMFGVRSIPFCVLFKGGQPVDGFVGALPEAEVRKFLDKHVPSAEKWRPRRTPSKPGADGRRRHGKRTREAAGRGRDQSRQRRCAPGMTTLRAPRTPAT
jgi:thioredoxin